VKLILRILYAELLDAWLRFKLRTINPTSPYVSELVIKRRELADMKRTP
jgi:hypothetical protein